jgi:hypothetical protein
MRGCTTAFCENGSCREQGCVPTNLKASYSVYTLFHLFLCYLHNVLDHLRCSVLCFNLAAETNAAAPKQWRHANAKVDAEAKMWKLTTFLHRPTTSNQAAERSRGFLLLDVSTRYSCNKHCYNCIARSARVDHVADV